MLGSLSSLWFDSNWIVGLGLDLDLLSLLELLGLLMLMLGLTDFFFFKLSLLWRVAVTVAWPSRFLAVYR